MNTEARCARKAPARRISSNIGVESFCLKAGGTSLADVCLSSDVSVYGFQFDMALPEGVSLQGVTLDESCAGAAGSDILKFTRLKSGLYRVLCASTSDIPFAVNDAPAIRMTIAAENGVTDGDYDMTLSGIYIINGKAVRK